MFGGTLRRARTDATEEATMSETRVDIDPLVMILPVPVDRASWCRVDTATAADTHERIAIYQHQVTGRSLRLDGAGRVYGQDAQGVIRLFARGGAMALAVALNAAYDGDDHLRPARVVLPDSAAPVRR